MDAIMCYRAEGPGSWDAGADNKLEKQVVSLDAIDTQRLL